MRSIAGMALAMVLGCGPAIGNSSADDDDWMLGTFSYTRALCGDTCMGGAQRFELSKEGQGQVIGVTCEESSEPLSWTLQGDGSVRIEWDPNGRPRSLTLPPPGCNEDGLVVHERTRTSHATPTSNESTSPAALYRSAPCPGPYIPGDDCEDDGSECDPRGFCEIVWCEGGEPERCE